MQNYKPTNFTIQNWGFIGDQNFTPATNGNLIFTGENGAGKTSTMNAFIPFLLTGNLKDSSVFNTFDKNKDLDNPNTTKRTSSAARTLVDDVLGNHDKLTLSNAQGQPFTNRIAYSAVTLDNGADSFTLGVLLEVKNHKLHDQRWFILDDNTNIVPEISVRDQSNHMLSLNDFVETNQEKFDNKFYVYPTDALYRIALATRYGIQSPTKNADAFIQKYSSLIQLTGSGTLVADKSLNITKLSNHIKHAMPAIDSELTDAVLKDILDELKDNLQIQKVTKLSNQVQEINQLKSVLNYMTLYKDYQSQIGDINVQITQNTDQITKYNTKLAQKINEINSEKDHLAEAQKAQTESQTKFDDLNIDFHTKSQTKNTLAAKKESLVSHLNNNKRIHADINKLKGTIADLSKRKLTLENKLPELEQDLSSIESELIGTFAKLTASPIYQETETNWDQWSTDTITEYQKDYKSYHRLIKIIAANNKQISDSSDFVKSLNNIFTQIQQTLGNKPFIKSSIQNIKQIIDKHINKYSQNNQSLFDANQAILDDLPTELKTISVSEMAKYIDLLTEFHKSFKEHNDKTFEISVNNSQINEIANQISTNESELKALRLELGEDVDYQSQINDINQQIDDLMALSQQDLIDAKKDNDENIKIVNKHQQQISVLEADQAKLENNIKDIELQNQALTQNKQENIVSFNSTILNPFNERYDLALTIDDLTAHTYQPEIVDGYKVLINKAIQTISKLLDGNNSKTIFDNLNDINKHLAIKINSLLNDDNAQHITLIQELSQMNINTDNLTNHDTEHYDYPNFDLFNNLQNMLKKYQDKLANETTYRYHNNNNVVRLTTELAKQHMQFNHLLDQASDLLLQNDNINTIRIRLEHMIDHNQFTDNYQRLINPNTNLADKIEIIKQIILPHVDLENNNLDALIHDNDFKTEIKDCFDYRNWTHVNILMALANSDEFNIITNKTLANASGGEKTKMIIIPLLTITRLHLQQGTAESIPMLMSFDEFGSLLDDDNADDLLSTITEFGFSFIGSVPYGKEARLASGDIPLAIYQVDKSPDNHHTNSYINALTYWSDTSND